MVASTIFVVFSLTVSPAPDFCVRTIVLFLYKKGPVHHVLYPGPFYNLAVLVHYLTYTLSHIV